MTNTNQHIKITLMLICYFLEYIISSYKLLLVIEKNSLSHKLV